MAESTSVRTSSQERDGIFMHALVGAVLMFVLSFIPLSPVLGGAVAGYLHKRDGLKVGALAGLFAAIPIVAAVMFAITFVTPVVTSQGGSMVGPLVGFGLMGLVMLLLVGLYTAGLGALGGYLGVYLVESRNDRARSE